MAISLDTQRQRRKDAYKERNTRLYGALRFFESQRKRIKEQLAAKELVDKQHDPAMYAKRSYHIERRGHDVGGCGVPRSKRTFSADEGYDG